MIITSSLHLFDPSVTKKLKKPRINLRLKWLIKILWKYWVHWLPIMNLMETWTRMNKILLCMKHILVYMDMEWNSCLIRKNWNTRTIIYIKEYLPTVVEGVLCVLINDNYCCHGWEDISDIWEAAAMTGKFHGSLGDFERFIFIQGMISHQCGEWSMFILWKYKSPPLGIKPMSPGWQAGIPVTILC